VIAPNGATTSYTVDGLGNVTQEVSPDRGTINYTQDAAGNVITRTDARGITATMAYDALNRITSITYPTAGENVTLTYDRISPTDASCTNGVGRLCRVVDAGGTTSHAFDPRGNLTRMTRLELGQTYTTQYTYTGADRIATVTTPTGKTFTMGRDALGRVTSISGTIAGAATNFVQNVSYTAEGKVTGETFGDNVRETTTWDTDGREQATSFSTDTQTNIPLPIWAWAALGALLLGSIVYAARHPQRAQRIGLWLLLWLISASLTILPMPAHAVDTSRSYDAANNLIGRTNAGGSFTYTYDELLRLKSEAGPPKTQTFQYDPNGNRTSDGAGSYGVLTNSNRYATIRGTSATYLCPSQPQMMSSHKDA
jgi:YD repeat-containing protein